MQLSLNRHLLVHTVHTEHAVPTVRTLHTVFTIHTIHTVHTAHTIHTDTIDTIPLDEDAALFSAKGLTFNKEGNKDGGIIGGGSNPSRPHTPNPILAPTNIAWHNCRKLIYVPRSAQKGFAVGFWPLPEAFWPDIAAPALPQRSAHPNIKFTCTNQEPMIIDNLPFDTVLSYLQKFGGGIVKSFSWNGTLFRRDGSEITTSSNNI